MDPISALSLISGFARVYASLLNVDLRSSGDRFDVLRIQILAQRSRLQTIGRVLQFAKHTDPVVEGLFMQNFESLQLEFDKLESFEKKYGSLEFEQGSPSTPRRSYAQRFRLGLLELDRLKDSVRKITSLVDTLESLTPQMVSNPSDAKAMSTEQQMPTAGPSSGYKSQEEKQIKSKEANQLFRSLVSACEQTMRLISSSSEAFKEAFLSYRLWTYTLETENISALFRDMPAEIAEQWGSDILKLQYQTLAHLAWTLSQASEAFELKPAPETFMQLDVILNKVHDSGIQEDYFDSSDFANIYNDRKALQRFVIEESKLLVDSLLDCLPSLLHMAQSQQFQPISRVRVAVAHSLELDQSHPTSTKEMLEVAVRLAEGISEAFDEMSVDDGASADIQVDQSLRDLYNKETEKLRKWKEENGAKMNGKLTSQNKAVWEAVEAALFNMTDLLNHMSSFAKSTKEVNSELNSKADKLLADYARLNPNLKLNFQLTNDDNIKSAIQDFGDFVQSLVSMEVPLNLIAPPPVYEERFGDKIVLNVEGHLFQDGQLADSP